MLHIVHHTNTDGNGKQTYSLKINSGNALGHSLFQQ